MTTYTSVFGNDSIPVADSSYGSASLTSSQAFGWPEVESGAYLLYEMMDFASDGAYTVTLGAANQVSVGRAVTIVNRSAFTLTFEDAGNSTVSTLAAGDTKCLYVTDNSTEAGVWGVISLGAGTTLADASALAGYGLKVANSKIATNAEVTSQPAAYTVLSSDRGRVVAFTGSGSVNCNLMQSSTVGNGFLVGVSNQGSGSVVVEGFGTETVDLELNKTLAPGESAFFVTDGSNWVSIGYGRSTQFQFTKLILDITAGSPFTLTSVQAQNKLLQFIGTASANVIVNVPAVVAVYYVQAAYTGAYTLNLRCGAGDAGVVLNNTDRVIVYCDGVNVVLAQTSAAPATDIA